MTVERILFRNGTTVEWTAAGDPVLEMGEPGWDSTTKTLKIGDGVTAFSALEGLASTATPPAVPDPILLDDFNRTTANGWGNASDFPVASNTWSTVNTAARYSTATTDGGTAAMAFNNTTWAGESSGTCYMASIDELNAEILVTASFSANLTSGTRYIRPFVRRIANGSWYACQAYISASTTRIQFEGSLSNVAAYITGSSSYTIRASPLTANEKLSIRFRVSGGTTPLLQARAWLTAGSEPTGWQLEMTDPDAATTYATLQVAGDVGVQMYRSLTTDNISGYVHSGIEANAL